MIRNLTHTISLALLGLFVFSCEPEPTVPDQEKIYGVYFLDYNEAENKTNARASFYLNAPPATNTQKLELTHPSNVKYNNKLLVFDTKERYYTKDFVSLIESNFTYENYYGNQYGNVVTMVDSIDLFMSDSANSQNDFYFQVDGSPLQANEVIEIYVESLNSDLTFGSTFTSMSGLNIQISADQLSSLGLGPTLVRASRSMSINTGVNGPPVGGEVQTRYSVQDTVIIH